MQWTANGGANQQWDLYPVPGAPNEYRVVNAYSGLCADVKAGETADGTPVVQWPCSDGANQRWRLAYWSEGDYRLVSALPGGKVLSVRDRSDSDGTGLVIDSDTNDHHQRWQVSTP